MQDLLPYVFVNAKLEMASEPFQSGPLNLEVLLLVGYLSQKL